MEYVITCRLSETDFPIRLRGDDYGSDIARDMVLFSYALTSQRVLSMEEAQVAALQAFAEAQGATPGERTSTELIDVQVEHGSIIMTLHVAIGATDWSGLESILIWAGTQATSGALTTLGALVVTNLVKKLTTTDGKPPSVREHQEIADKTAADIAHQKHYDYRQVGLATIVHDGKRESGFKYEYMLFERYGWHKDNEKGRITVIVDLYARQRAKYALNPSRTALRLPHL